MKPSRVVFGLVVPPVGSDLEHRIEQIGQRMGEHMGVTLERRSAPSYAALAADVREGRVDLAWLPPIVFVRLADTVTALGSIMREGSAAYEAALIVRADSKVRTIDALRGTRAGWVDPWSAAGFVLPRVKLALSGVDPRTLFRTEAFHGSHRAAIQALLDGASDVAGTYARADASGNVSRGAWSEIEGAEVRVLATFGAIPPDVLAVRTALAGELQEPAFDAFEQVCADEESRTWFRAVFGGDELSEGLAPGYDTLQKALEMATSRGIFD